MRYPIPALCLLALALVVFIPLRAEDKKLPIEHNSNELVEISANVILDKEQIKQELGSDFGGDIVLVRVSVRPVSDKPVNIDLDDFLLVSGRDGQRSEPYRPGQLAGDDVLVVTRQEGKSSKGGFGIGLGGVMGGGGAGTSTPTTSTKAEKSNSDKPDPLLATLKEKMLPEKSTTETITGFLYFQVVGKVKPKDLELHYKSAAGKLSLRFHP